jgi:hypothetical protein
VLPSAPVSVDAVPVLNTKRWSERASFYISTQVRVLMILTNVDGVTETYRRSGDLENTRQKCTGVLSI